MLTFRDVGQIVGATAAQLGAIASLDFARVSAIGDDLDARLAKSRQTYEDFKKILNATAATGGPKPATGGTGRGRRPAPSFGDVGGAAGSGKTKTDEFAKALERVAKAAADADLELAAMFSTQEITGAQKALNALASSDEWKSFTEAQRQDLTVRYQAIDAIQRETAEWKKKREEQEKQIDVLKDLQAQQQQSVANFTAQLGQYADDNSFLERSIDLVGKEDTARQKLAETIQFEALKRQALLADDDPAAAAARIELLEQEYGKRLQLIDQLAAAEQRFAQVQQINTVFADAFADSIMDVVEGTKSLKDAFQDMARSITSAISRIAAQNLADALFGVGPGKSGGPGEIFAKMMGGSGGGGFDFSKILQSIFGFLGGGSGIDINLAGGGPPAFASGTNFAPGGLSLVGERGPELVNLPRGAQVIPNEVLMNRRSERAVSVVNNFTVSGQTSRASQHQIAARASQAVAAAARRR